MTIVAGESRGFQVGDIIVRSVRLFGANIVSLAALALLIWWGPGFLTVFEYGRIPADQQTSIGVSLAFAAVAAVQDVAMGAAVTVVVLGQPGQPIRASLLSLARIARVLPTLLPLAVVLHTDSFVSQPIARLAGAQLAHALAVGQGMSIAGLLLASSLASLGLLVATTAALGLAPAVLAAEGGGTFEVLRRSFRLLAGSRWRLCALLAMIAVAETVIAYVARSVGIAAPLLKVWHATFLLTAPIAVLWPVMVAVSYRELTRVKEGWRPA